MYISRPSRFSYGWESVTGVVWKIVILLSAETESFFSSAHVVWRSDIIALATREKRAGFAPGGKIDG